MRERAARQSGGSGRGARRPVLLFALLASVGLAGLFLGCSPEGGAGLRPSIGSGAGSSGGGGAAGLLPRDSGSGSSDGASGAGGGSGSSRHLLLEPIVEERSSGGGSSLGKEDLRSLGELSILPHVVQSLSGAPCDFKDAMSNCQ